VEHHADVEGSGAMRQSYAKAVLTGAILVGQRNVWQVNDGFDLL
jgi:hypothetical protein